MIAINSDLFSRARIYRTSGALTLALVLSGTVHATQSLHVALTQPANQRDQEVGKVVITMTNTGNETIDLLKNKTPFLDGLGDLPGPLFAVRDGFGKTIAYKGGVTTFSKITADSYIHLLPGDAIQKVVDLSEDYQLSDGPYSIDYDQDLSRNPDDALASPLASMANTTHSQSNTVQIWVNGSLLAAKRSPLADVVPRAHAVLLSGNRSTEVPVAAVEGTNVTTYAEPGITNPSWPLGSNGQKLPLTFNIVGAGGGGGGGGGADEGLVLPQGFRGGGGGGGGGGASYTCTATGNPLSPGTFLQIEVGAGGAAGVGGAAGGKVALSGSPGTPGGTGGSSLVAHGLTDSVTGGGGAGGTGGGGGGLGVGSGGLGGSGGAGSGPLIPGLSSFTCSPGSTVGNAGQSGSSSGGAGSTAGQAAIPATCGSAGKGADGGAGGPINSSSGAASNGSDGAKGNNGCVVFQY